MGTDTQAIRGEFSRGLAPDRRRALLRRIRADEDGGLRESWDRCAAVFRVLEDAEVSGVEIDQVERWLLEDFAIELEPEATPTWGARLRRALARPRVWGPGLALAALAMALLIGPSDPAELGPADHESWIARGFGLERGLGIDAVCGRPPRSSAAGPCRLDEELAFVYRWPAPLADAGRLERAYLSVFGVDEAGEILYYAPTPVDPPVSVERSVPEPEPEQRTGWRRLGFALRLGVNHESGRVRVYALLSPRAPTLAAIEVLARELAFAEVAEAGAPPWHRRLGRDRLHGLCIGLERCSSAELVLTIEGEER